MNTARRVNIEPIPGYRLIEQLGAGGFGEVWKCEAPGGLFKAVKFVRGEDDHIHAGGDGAARELKALQHVKSLRHPFLLGMDRVEYIDGDLVIVMELADRSLHDLLGEYQAAGLPGVPRAELLRYFAETAEVLDLLNHEHGLQHLDIKPRNLFLVGRHVKVGDFGLVNSLAQLSGNTPTALQMGAATPLYAAPESFLGRITMFSDQYSLAITYHELLAGAPPFVGKNFRQVALQHMQAEADLFRLPAADRPAVARALSKEPRQRFPSCTAFVEALLSGKVDAPVGPPPSAPCRPKAATKTDIPVVDLSATPLVPIHMHERKDTPPEVARQTREVSPSGPPASRDGWHAFAAPPGPPGNTPAATGRESMPPLGNQASRGNGASGAHSADPLAGWRFLECIGRNSAGETWTARTPDGRDRLVRFLCGVDLSAGTEVQRLARLRTLTHPGLDPMEVVGGGAHRLAVVTEACATTLAARLAECQAADLPGVPRQELLGRLQEAAKTLDDLCRKEGVRHLALTPRSLLVRDGRLGILHYGLMDLIHMPGGQSPGLLNPRYAAPELFEGRPHSASDLYSLALIYCELLTGVHPFRALGQRQVTLARQRGQPDLSLAPAPDRALLECALHPDPARRPATCTEFIAALQEGPARPAAPSSVQVLGGVDLSATPTTRSRMRQAINGLVAAAAGDVEVREFHAIRYLVHPGRSVEHQFFARVAPGMARLRFSGFRQEWRAEALPSDDQSFNCVAPLAAAGWQRLLGMRSGLRIHVAAPVSEAGELTDVQVQMEPVRCGADLAMRALNEAAPRLLESLREHFQAHPERRNQARLRYKARVHVTPVLGEQEVGERILTEATDISLRGMGLLMPCRPPSMLLQVRLPADAPDQEVEVPACIVRATPQDDGCYDVGVRFLVEEEY
jgi:serine/threonine protein kinase